MADVRIQVFVSQEVPALDFSKAEDYGDVVFITRFEHQPFETSLLNKKLVAEIRDRLSDFRPDIDYICPAGSPIVTGLVFMILREITDKVQVLVWSNRDRGYRKHFISLEDGDGKKENREEKNARI